MITSYYGFLLQMVNIFTIDSVEYYPVCYRVNMMSRPCILFHALCSQISITYVLYIAD